MDRLARVTRSRLSSKRSSDVLSAFSASFAAANSIATSNFGNPDDPSPRLPSGREFAETWRHYNTQIRLAFAGHPFARWFGPFGWIDAAGTNPLGDLVAIIDELGFKFALADFLVTHDLAAVVDFACGDFDQHNEMDKHALTGLATFAGIRTLMRRLRSRSSPDTGGRSLMDLTSMVITSEFDREPLLSALEPAFNGRPGTNHWESASAILIGAGFRGGRVIGDFLTGERKKLGSGLVERTTLPQVRSPSGVPNKPYTGFPIDPKTGAISANGVYPSVRSIFPTVLAAFAAPRTHLRDARPLEAALA
jgi:hypothetical protein